MAEDRMVPSGVLQQHMSNPKINVVGIIFQNNFGERYYSKYFTKHSTTSTTRGSYNLTLFEDQRKFEKGLLEKVRRMNVVSKLKADQNQIFSFGDYTVLLKVINELQICLVCDEEENYFLMESVINCIGQVLQMVSKEQYVGKAIYDNLDSIVVVTDEIIDEGIIVHLDPNVIYDRMKMKDPLEAGKKVEVGKPQPPAATAGMSGTFTSFFGFAKSSLQKTLNLG